MLSLDVRRMVMPTILQILGWRLFFYANEGNEPPHVHVRKAEKECKYWLDRDGYDLEEAFSYQMTARDTREVRKIVFEHFDYILQQWDECERRKKNG
jgi:hypothetical protein